MAHFPGFELDLLGMDQLKSFAMLVGYTQGATPTRNREIGSSGDRVIGKALPTRLPEACYAYYRRCQQFRRNGEQCKAPAMKGEAICHGHAEQADAERRRQQQRRKLLARPGAGLGSFRAIQRTISELARAILADTIDRKAAGRLMMEIQTAIRVQKMHAAQAPRSKALPLKSVLGEVEGRHQDQGTCHGDQRSRGLASGFVAFPKSVAQAPSPVTSLHRGRRLDPAARNAPHPHSRGRLCHKRSRRPGNAITKSGDVRLKLRRFPSRIGARAPIVSHS